MTKKDYELIAACIGGAFAATRNNSEERGVESVAGRIELELSLENPSFDKAKFRARIEAWMDIHSKP